MAPKKVESEEMELFRTEDYFVLLNTESSLWCSRRTGEIEAKPSWELANSGDLECLGVFYGFVGKIDLHSDSSRLVLIKETTKVGQLPDSRTVVKIKSVTFVDPCSSSESPSPSVDLKPCKKHRQGSFNINFEVPQKAAFAKTWGQIKSATSTIKNTTQHAAALATYQVKNVSRRESKDRERFEKRILEELNRIFTDPESFYFCVGPAGSSVCDLTNSLQRSSEENPMIDDRFFWNKHMLKDVLEINNEYSKPWVLPIIQGFVQIEECKLEYDQSPNGVQRVDKVDLVLISRRSRHRAGTRYKRRGLDESGRCANYVETEQILASNHHQVSLVQVRGSVPLYWSQRGFKYRPPPLIDKGEVETRAAFEKHLKEEIDIYKSVCIVNLVEQTGREKVLWDGFTYQVMQYNSDKITYTTFDFHEHCRGLRFENVSLLVQRLEEVTHEMGFFWRDREGVIYRQSGVFRVNCMDCLDRTNVVQTAIAKVVMETQLTKLGLFPPEQALPSNLRTTFQLMWANNGDVISKQYAGTAALKGDYTRTGERKITGLVKDGMNSANRYYLSRFKDAYRQATIDIMQGECVNPDMNPEEESDADLTATAEHVKLLLEDCKKILIPDSSLILGAWGLINADPVSGDPTETDVDTILILTRDSYYVADYDDELDQVVKLQQVLLEDITMVEMGPMPAHIHSPMQIFNKSKNRSSSHYCLRFRYKQYEKLGTHTFRSSNLRFFNNVAVVIKNDEEMIESMRAIHDCIQVALDMAGVNNAVEWIIDQPLTVRPSGGSGGINMSNQSAGIPQLGVLSPISRNVSESQLASLKSVGSKALSNVTSTFSKLGNSLTPGRKNSCTKETSLKPRFKVALDLFNERTKKFKREWKENRKSSNNRAHHSKRSAKRKKQIVTNFILTSQSMARDNSSVLIEMKNVKEFIIGGGGKSSGTEGGVSDSDDDVICSPTRDSFLPTVGIVMSQRIDGTSSGSGEKATPSIMVASSGIGSESQRRVPTSLLVTNQHLPQPLQVKKLSTECLCLCERNIHEELNRSVQLLQSVTSLLKLKHLKVFRIRNSRKRSPLLRSSTKIRKARTLSRSSEEVVIDEGDRLDIKTNTNLLGKSSSERDLTLKGLPGSQSENALKSIRSAAKDVLTSPSAVLSPLGKLARGVQSLGQNLDPRRLKSGGSNRSGITQSAENERLVQAWSSAQCKSRLIAV